MPLVLLTTVVTGQSPKPQLPNPAQPIFRADVEGVVLTATPRDAKGRFISGLSADRFEVFEDGVLQKVTYFNPIVGGRSMAASTTPAPPKVSEGIVRPAKAPATDTSGRIFIIFVDDYHVQPGDTPRLKDALKQIRDTVIHDNDLVGFVSTGFSAIEGSVNYDYKHRRFDEIIGKATGSAMTPDDIVKANTTVEGPSGLRYRVHSTFETAYGLLNDLSKITNRRKALIYVSSGYDLNPFKDSRYLEEQRKYSTTPEGVGGRPPGEELNDPNYSNPFEKNGMQFLDTDLIADIAELVRAARRANVTFYTLDPRGLVAGIADINMAVTNQEWMATVRNQIDTLRVLGDETGGFCICNMNNYKPGLQRIDNEMSDYYVIGYVSNNPDPMKRLRKIEIRVNNPAAKDVSYLQDYRIAKPKRR